MSIISGRGRVGFVIDALRCRLSLIFDSGFIKSLFCAFKDLEFFNYDEVEYGIADDLNWFGQDQVN